MNKRKLVKALMASAVMLGSATAAVTAEEPQVTYETILGDAYDYGITASSFHQGNHMQSNFAAIDFSGQNVIEADLSGEGHVPIIAGTIASDSVLRFGNHTANDQPMTYDVTTSSADRVTTDNPQKGQLNIVNKSSSEIAGKVNAMIDHFVASSATLKDSAPSIVLSDNWWEHFDQNNAIIDLTSYGDSATVYINVPDTAYNFRNALNCSNGLHIVKNSGTTVVFNIPDESISFNKFRVSVNGQEYNTDPSTAEGTINQNMDNEIIRKIYFNCYNAKTVTLANTAGLFLVPRSDATVTVAGTSSGWIATAGHVTNPSGEWHFAFHARSAETTNPGETPVVPDPEPEPEPTPAKHDVAISKIDAANSAEIAGATLIVTDAEHNKVEQWVSEADTTHMISLEEGTYTLTEITAPDGYEVAESIPFEVGADGLVKVDGNTVDKVIMKDEPTPVVPEPTPEPEKVSVTVTKVWEDADNQDGKRPQDITVVLTANGVEQSAVKKTLSAESGWTATFEDLNKYDESNNKIAYSVNEVAVDGYTSTVQANDTGVMIVNTHTPETQDIFVKTEFSEDTPKKPDVIDVDLLGNQKPIASTPLTEDNDYSHTFEDMPIYEEGEPITFNLRVRTPVPGFKTAVSGGLDEGFTLIADYDEPDTGKLIITKMIEGPVTEEEAEGALRFELYATDTGDSWGYTLADFDYDDVTGKYTLSLDMPVGNYEVVESVTSIEGYTLASVSYSINGGESVNDTFADVQVEKDKTVEVAYRDEYESEPHPVTFSKIAGDTNERLAGATLILFDDSNNQIERWKTDADKDHVVMLKAGTYRLTERVVPNGYQQANDINFIVGTKGNVVLLKDNPEDSEDVDKIIMVDEAIPDVPETPEEPKPDPEPTPDPQPTARGSITINKVIVGDIAEDDFMNTFSFDIYDTQNGDVYSLGLEDFGRTDDSKVFSVEVRRDAGTYEVFEDAKAIEGYELTTSYSINGSEFAEGNHIDCVVNPDENVVVTFMNTYTKVEEPVEETHKVVISKQDITGKEIAGAELVVTRSGKEVDRWVSVKDKSHEIELIAGDYILTETIAPEGFKIARSIHFTLDSEGHIFVASKQVDKVVMVDDYDRPAVPGNKPSSNTEGKKPDVFKPSEGVNTSDRANVFVYTAVLMSALLAFVGTAVFKHRH